MSAPLSTDLVLVNRGSMNYRATIDDLKTRALSTDLLLVNRGGTDFKCTVEDFLFYVSTIPTVSGGTITTDGGYTYHEFTSNGTLSVIGGSLRVEYIVIGGGGGGGGFGNNGTYYAQGGGGGGGGVRQGTILIPEGSYSVSVGLGGAKAAAQGQDGGDGQPSSIGTLIVAQGGGGGGGYGLGSSGGRAGRPGGSGGGGGSSAGSYAGAAALGGIGVSGQGSDGHVGQKSSATSTVIIGGCGGGAGGTDTRYLTNQLPNNAVSPIFTPPGRAADSRWNPASPQLYGIGRGGSGGGFGLSQSTIDYSGEGIASSENTGVIGGKGFVVIRYRVV